MVTRMLRFARRYPAPFRGLFRCGSRGDQTRAVTLIAATALILVAGIGCTGKPTGSGAGPAQTSAQSAATFQPSDELWELNNRGLGYMEQFDEGGGFPRAVEVFEEIVRRWPDWPTGKFNLAVAVLNEKPDDEHIERAKGLLRELLATNDQDARAHYTLGFLLQYQGRPEEALPHLAKVCTDLKPDDAQSWMRLGDCISDLGAESPPDSVPSDLKPATCYERALQLNPNLASAYYKLSQQLRSGDRSRNKELLERFTRLTQGPHDAIANDYLWAGALAEAIGTTVPGPRASDRPLPIYEPMDAAFGLFEGARWATDEDLKSSSHGGLLARMRHRFGAGVAAFDFDRDGDLDLFLPASSIRNGRLCDTLLRNDGEGRFVDVTQELGLAGPRESIGCAAGDFDADGNVDLFITAVSGNLLFRQADGKFEEVTDKAGVALSEYLCVTPALLDVDHDGDLDLVVAVYGPLADSDKMFVAEPYRGGAASALFLNVGPARTAEPAGKDMPPLEVGFKRLDPEQSPWNHAAATVAFLAADLDNDRDLDLVEVNDDAPCRLLINQRLGNWNSEELTGEGIPAGPLNGGLIADLNGDLSLDLVLIPPSGPITILHNESCPGFDRPPVLKPATTDVSDLQMAQAVDIDFDGWTDLVGLARRADSSHVVLGSNRPRGLLARPEWLGGLFEERDGPQSVLVADFCGGWPQILVLRSGHPPVLLRTEGNGNNWLGLQLVGHRERATSFDKKLPRSNLNGIGTRLVVRAGPNSVAWDRTTPIAGLCHSLMADLVGLGDRKQADTVHLRWPSGLEQAELNLPAGGVCAIEETRRRGTSCPLLFVWNGRRFEFVTDFLGGGGIGYLVAPGSYSEPDPDEDFKLDPAPVPDQRNRLVLKIAEPMDEMTYLDAVWLEVIDHRRDVTVYPDERFEPESPHRSGERLFYRDRIMPRAARDHRGRDVLAKLEQWDRRTVDGFRTSAAWIGYAEDHYVELDFGHEFAGLRDDEPVALFLAGWVEYPYSQTNWAAATAGTTLRPPVLEWQNAAGQWEPLVTNFGYPAGLPRMMTVELTGKLASALRGLASSPAVSVQYPAEPFACRLRIRTNMEIYWDQIFAARLVTPGENHTTTLKPVAARLAYRGYLQEYSPDGSTPNLFDYHQIASVPLVGLQGKRTPYGDVCRLVQHQDDDFVLINAGDEVTVEFAADQLPELPAGWTRSFILRSFGYCKDTDLFNPAGTYVEPLPKTPRKLNGPDR